MTSSGADECINGGLGSVFQKVKIVDPDADALAEKIGGVPRAAFTNDPLSDPREFDVISDKYIAQAKPALKIGSQFKNQAKATFEYAMQSGRIPYFHFNDTPGPGVLEKIAEYSTRYGIEPVIDIGPLS